MAREHGKGSTITVAAQDISVFADSSSLDHEIDTEEVTGYGDDSKAYITGTMGATLNVSGSYDAALLGPEDTLHDALMAGAAVAFTWVPGAGGSTYSGNGIVKKWGVSAPVNGRVAFSGEILVTGDLARA